MRVFLCAFTGFLVAIPMHAVSSLVLYTDGESVQENICVSLPLLFNLPQENIRHGIILKNNIILLVTEVICETEISQEAIFPLPKIFNVMRFSMLFSGIQFDSRIAETAGNPVLLLNSEQIIQSAGGLTA